jgi:DNA-binding beta-propeller fold protein YncE
LINIFFLLCGHIISYSAAYSNHPLLLSSSLYYLVSDGVSVEEETENNNPLGFKSIKKFDSNGKSITSWGSEGYGDGQFWLPHDIAIDSSDNVYVTDSGNVHEKKDNCTI